MPSEHLRIRLQRIIQERAISYGDFKLASGKNSKYYINSKQFLLNSEAAALLSMLLFQYTEHLDIQAAGGLEMGAVPLATACAIGYRDECKKMEGFYVRKEAKDHGTQSRIEGHIPSGGKVVILDDVMTTGGSACSAVHVVEAAGFKVVGVVCVIDRLQGARKMFEPNYVYHSIFTVRDFGIEPDKE